VKKTADSLRRIGLIANPEKPRSIAVIRKAVTQLKRLGKEILCDSVTAQFARLNTVPTATDPGTLATHCDLLLVFGGDGTMLQVARETAGAGVPILGINAGHLGFLAAIQEANVADALRTVLAGRFRIENRALLEAVIHRDGSSTVQTALNDFVLSRGLASRLIELEVAVNGELLTRYRCDGLIASSPTGSTAYSLAAGGAIVSPDADVLTLTPICPHTLSIRPVVMSLDSVVQVTLLSRRLEATLAGDGQQQTHLSTGDRVLIRRSNHVVKLLRPEGSSFFSTLREKFGWSGGNL
jgi:NAD+ kinase